jgi:hypothetical protein
MSRKSFVAAREENLTETKKDVGSGPVQAQLNLADASSIELEEVKGRTEDVERTLEEVEGQERTIEAPTTSFFGQANRACKNDECANENENEAHSFFEGKEEGISNKPTPYQTLPEYHTDTYHQINPAPEETDQRGLDRSLLRVSQLNEVQRAKLDFLTQQAIFDGKGLDLEGALTLAVRGRITLTEIQIRYKQVEQFQAKYRLLRNPPGFLHYALTTQLDIEKEVAEDFARFVEKHNRAITDDKKKEETNRYELNATGAGTILVQGSDRSRARGSPMGIAGTATAKLPQWPQIGAVIKHPDGSEDWIGDDGQPHSRSAAEIEQHAREAVAKVG